MAEPLLTGTDATGRAWSLTSVTVRQYGEDDLVSMAWHYDDEPGTVYTAGGFNARPPFVVDDVALADPGVLAEIARQHDALAAQREASRLRLADDEARVGKFTADAAARRAECVRDGTPVYVRFGGLPQAGSSTNHRDNRAEDGVCVYAGWRMPDGTIVLDMDDTNWTTLAGIQHRPMFIATGRRVGYGTDGEPLLTDVTLTPAGATDYEMI